MRLSLSETEPESETVSESEKGNCFVGYVNLTASTSSAPLVKFMIWIYISRINPSENVYSIYHSQAYSISLPKGTTPPNQKKRRTRLLFTTIPLAIYLSLHKKPRHQAHKKAQKGPV